MAITQVFNDTFTDADSTLLTAHTPEQGSGWSPIIGNGGTNARIQGGTLVQPFYSSNEASYYTADTTESPTLAQEVVFTFSAAASRTSRIALRLRDGSSSADCVLIEFSTSLNIVKIYSVVEGVLTEISSAGAGGLIVDNVQCKVAIDASNNVSGDIGGTPLAFNPAPVVSGHDVAGKFGWRGVKSYTDNGISSFTGFYDVGAGGTSNITISETLPALSGSLNLTFTPAAGTSNITINDTLPALDSSLTMTYAASGVGTITIPDWANNTGTALPSITDITVNVRSLVDGSTVYRTTTASTDVNADCVVSDVAIVTGTSYEVTALKFNGVDYDIGIAIITAT